MKNYNSKKSCLNLRLISLLISYVLSLLVFYKADAQFANVPCTGYNTDVVLNGAGTALTSVTGSTATVDNPGGY